MLFFFAYSTAGRLDVGLWKERCYLASSILFCSLAVVLGIVLFPLILLFFASVALIHPIFRRGETDGTPSRRVPPEGSGA